MSVTRETACECDDNGKFRISLIPFREELSTNTELQRKNTETESTARKRSFGCALHITTRTLHQGREEK